MVRVTKIFLTSKGKKVRRLLDWIYSEVMAFEYATPTALKQYAKHSTIKQRDIKAWIKELELMGLISIEDEEEK